MTSRPEVLLEIDPDGVRWVRRFSLGSRWVHGLTAALMIVCILTAAVLYNGSLAVAVGHRYVVETVHVVCGLGLPVPLILGSVSRHFRDDARRLNRFTRRDWTWLRSSDRRTGRVEVGKFNAGQKLNAALSTGAIAALFVSGLVMYLTGLTSLAWRSGATFVHDWFSLAVGLLVLGHLVFAFRDPEALRGMRTGRVPLAWARREHGAWAREVVGDPVVVHGASRGAAGAGGAGGTDGGSGDEITG